MFQSTPDDLDMHIIYDVSHNIAKVEEHVSVLNVKHDSWSKDWLNHIEGSSAVIVDNWRCEFVHSISW